MAKKKKHRKTRKQKVAKNTTQAVGSATANKNINQSNKAKEKNIISADTTSKDQKKVEETSLYYVKHDVRRSLTLVGIILVVFFVLFFILEKTSIGTQVYSIIKF